MTAYEILRKREVTRLCHFTLFKNLTHIMSSNDGIKSSDSIRQDIRTVTDEERYDGELNYVCCSVQYPNSWFLRRALQKNSDEIFNEWVVLYIDLRILQIRHTKFCPCNASKGNGMYIRDDINDIEEIFKDSVPTFEYPRSSSMLTSCPTDGQAEILIKNNIPREYIKGIAVGSKDIAKRVYSMLSIYGLHEKVPIFIAPDILSTEWSKLIKKGIKPKEILFFLRSINNVDSNSN